MKSHRFFPNLLVIIMTVGLVSATTELAAGPLKVVSADPNLGYTGETHTVTINGTGFTKAKNVRFLVTKTDLTGGVSVELVSVDDDATITAKVIIPLSATVSDYDIEVQLAGGRKGKGTTLFKVQSKPNQTTVTCPEVFDFELPGTGSSCTCVFNPPDNDPSYGLLGDCVTSETLFLKSGIRTDGSVQSNGPLFLTLTAVGCNPNEGQDCTYVGVENFLGSSVISNRNERVSVRFLNIRFADDVTRGCGEDDDIQTAISFVLDENTIDDPEKNSLLTVFDINIDTQKADGTNDPLCTAVEIVREPGFTKYDDVGNQVFANQDWRMMVENVEIAEGSYQQTGIRLEGMQPTQSINPPIVSNNYIGAPGCDSSDEAVAIWFGNILLSDPSDDTSQIAGQLESNTIRMENSDCLSVGIKVVGEPEPTYQTSAEVIKNVISGAMVGVEVDDKVLNVHFSGNTLVGDPDHDDFGICSDAKNTSTKGKPNIWSGYVDEDHEIRYSPCP